MRLQDRGGGHGAVLARAPDAGGVVAAGADQHVLAAKEFDVCGAKGMEEARQQPGGIVIQHASADMCRHHHRRADAAALLGLGGMLGLGLNPKP